ncbi:MAG: glycosyltransferase [Burkholderiaceae bacterium]
MALIVFSSLFPSAATPVAGLFIRERMFRVNKHFPIIVIAPQSWSPLDRLIRRFRPSFRPPAVEYEVMDGVRVYRPRFLSIPGYLKKFDGRLMATGARRVLKQLAKQGEVSGIDAHFLYPDGYAASVLARELGVPYLVTMRGSKDSFLVGTDREPMMRECIAHAQAVICVSESLAHLATRTLGASATKTTVVGNGIDTERFRREPREPARDRLDIPRDATLLLSVGHLTNGKGFHRVIPLLPGLRKDFPKLMYVIVGGDPAHQNKEGELRELADAHGVGDIVRLAGRQSPDELRWFYSAADLFVLATAYEGWANVFLESMACGLPIVTTRVGGNEQVIPDPTLGTLVEFWDPQAFEAAIRQSLAATPDPGLLIEYAQRHAWDRKIQDLLQILARTASKDDHHN